MDIIVDCNYKTDNPTGDTNITSNPSYCSGERHLGYSLQDLLGVSFYHFLHPDSMRELQAKHRLGETLTLSSPRHSNL